MKKLFIVVMILVIAFSFAGCGGKSDEKAEPEKKLELEGNWKQTNSEAEDTWMNASIEGETITVNWVSDNGETTSLYWAGSFIAPDKPGNEYSWTSNNDKEKTEMAILASEDDTKEFTVSNDTLSFKVSVMGTTTTVKMKKEK